MKINYRDTEGKFIELEVADEVGAFYLESLETEKKNNRNNSRPGRHISLTEIEGFLCLDAGGHAVQVDHKPELPKHVFNHGSQAEMQLIKEESLTQILSCLSERQQYLIRKCWLEGWSYADLAALEGKDESAIRHAVDRARQRLKKFLS